MLLLYRHTRNNLLTLVKFYLEPRSMHDVLVTCTTVIAQTRGKDVFCLQISIFASLCMCVVREHHGGQHVVDSPHHRGETQIPRGQDTIHPSKMAHCLQSDSPVVVSTTFQHPFSFESTSGIVHQLCQHSYNPTIQ